MAIFGAGSNWEGEEMKDEFFENQNYVIGWSYDDSKDLYDIISVLKAGDIIYLKSNQSGSRTLRIKGIGVVCQSLLHNFFDAQINRENLSIAIKVKWIVKEEFKITIPSKEGKLTNFRAATFYEEFLPFVQKHIIETLFNQ